jgi:hypothetical protein
MIVTIGADLLADLGRSWQILADPLANPLAFFVALCADHVTGPRFFTDIERAQNVAGRSYGELFAAQFVCNCGSMG